MQLEVYSRSKSDSLWLSVLGDIDVIKKFNSPEQDCEILRPKNDYVVTEVFITSRPRSGVTYVQMTFSEDFGVHDDLTR